MRYLSALLIGLCATSAQAEAALRWDGLPVDVVILGEVHDNPAHHARQAEIIAELEPTAVVYEMLTPEEALRLKDTHRTVPAMAEAVLTDFHWSNLADYAEVLAATQGVIVGTALPRGEVRQAFAEGAASVMGASAARFGLTEPVPEAELDRRKTLQFEAHCEAMPLEMMGGMVEAQRLRDAVFAETILDTLAAEGAPVVLVTGNGHARRDWGVPAYLAQAASEVSVITIGQGEAGNRPEGGFDAVFDAPAVDRPEPCAAFE